MNFTRLAHYQRELLRKTGLLDKTALRIMDL